MAGVLAKIALLLDLKETTVGDLGTPASRTRIEHNVEFDPGTADDGDANILFADRRTLAASATENLDLAGALASAFGVTIAAAEIVAIYIAASAANTNDVVFFGAASNPFNGPLSGTTPKVTLKPGDFALFKSADGWGVTAATGDIALVANSAAGSTVTYDIVLIGRTAAT